MLYKILNICTKNSLSKKNENDILQLKARLRFINRIKKLKQKIMLSVKT